MRMGVSGIRGQRSGIRKASLRGTFSRERSVAGSDEAIQKMYATKNTGLMLRYARNDGFFLCALCVLCGQFVFLDFRQASSFLNAQLRGGSTPVRISGNGLGVR